MKDLLEIIKSNIGKSRLVPVWKIRRLYGKDFEKDLINLLQTFRIELTGGNPSTLTDEQLAGCITLDGFQFLNICFHD